MGEESGMEELAEGKRNERREEKRRLALRERNGEKMEETVNGKKLG